MLVCMINEFVSGFTKVSYELITTAVLLPLLTVNLYAADKDSQGLLLVPQNPSSLPFELT